jgi:hypothetical protein
MHLHLGGNHSDVLVFLIQYANKVVLLETNTHVHFRTQPAGKNILALNQSWLWNLEAEMHDALASAAAAATEAERRHAEERRDRVIASMANFKKAAGLE